MQSAYARAYGSLALKPSCDRRAPGDRLRTCGRSGTPEAGDIDLRTGGSHLK